MTTFVREGSLVCDVVLVGANVVADIAVVEKTVKALAIMEALMGW